MTRLKRFPWLIETFLLVLIPAIVYLPNAIHLTYQRDDWYFMYDGHIAGPNVFLQMFQSDRPARGVFFDAVFRLFGTQPLPYQLGTFFLHILAGLAALWVFRILWPRQRRAGFLVGLFVILYPAYFMWVQGIEYLPHTASLFLEILSIAFSLKVVQAQRPSARVAWFIGALATGWVYLSLVEYAIGMEIFRFMCIALLVGRTLPRSQLGQKALATLRVWWFNLFIPLGFLFWRLFIFQNERKATDVGLQLSRLFGTPQLTGPWWFIRLFQSMLNTTVLAWTSPFNQQFFALRLRDMAAALGVALLSVLLFAAAAFLLKEAPELASAERNWHIEAIFLGLIGSTFGLLPVVVANREVTFSAFSYYGLPASLTAVFFAVGMLSLVNSQKARFILTSLLLASAAITHYGLGISAYNEQQTIRDFWRQVTWRAPMIRSGTTIVAEYPDVVIGQDTDIIWGPANFIYYPNQANQVPVQYALSAVTTSSDDVQNVLSHDSGGFKLYRSHTMKIDYTNILILSQPVDGACVHAIDGRMPRLSPNASNAVSAIAEYSNINDIVSDAAPVQLPVFLFGPPPVQDWCYFYEKADLAVQQGDFKQAAALGKQVREQGLHPVDRSEWIPFLQAYAFLNDQSGFEAILENITGGGIIKDRACSALQQMEKLGYKLSPAMQAARDAQVCNK